MAAGRLHQSTLLRQVSRAPRACIGADKVERRSSSPPLGLCAGICTGSKTVPALSARGARGRRPVQHFRVFSRSKVAAQEVQLLSRRGPRRPAGTGGVPRCLGRNTPSSFRRLCGEVYLRVSLGNTQACFVEQPVSPPLRDVCQGLKRLLRRLPFVYHFLVQQH